MELPDLPNIVLNVTKGAAKTTQSKGPRIFLVLAFVLGLLLGIMLESGIPFLVKLLLIGGLIAFVVFLWLSGILTLIVELVIVSLILLFYFLKNVVIS